MRNWLIAAFLLAASSTLAAQDDANCRFEGVRNANVNADGARRLVIEAGSGSLTIEGKPGLDRVLVRGRACASSRELLEEIRFRQQRSGSDVEIVANISRREWDFRNGGYARLDLVIEVPARWVANITDGSGSMDLTNLGSLEISDGSGEIVADNIAGDIRIEDGSGGIRLIDVDGSVEIDDGSGEISLYNIAEAVQIDDSSGGINIVNAQRSVRISDSSGSIDVRDVGGDFVVDRDSSGSIRYDNVKGRVDVPRHRR